MITHYQQLKKGPDPTVVQYFNLLRWLCNRYVYESSCQDLDPKFISLYPGKV